MGQGTSSSPESGDEASNRSDQGQRQRWSMDEPIAFSPFPSMNPDECIDLFIGELCIDANAPGRPERRPTLSMDDLISVSSFSSLNLDQYVDPFVTEFRQKEPRIKEIIKELQEIAAEEKDLEQSAETRLRFKAGVRSACVGFGGLASRFPPELREKRQKTMEQILHLAAEFRDILQSLQSKLEDLKRTCGDLQRQFLGDRAKIFIVLETNIGRLSAITAQLRRHRDLSEQVDDFQKILWKLQEIHSDVQMLVSTQ